MRRFAIEFFDKENGSEPAKEFIFSLDKKIRTKVLFILDILADNGYELRGPYSKHLEDGIFELRAKVGSDISSVLYFFYVGSRIVLTNGFIKKTQKTPEQQIKLAKQYRAEYLKRMEDK